MDQVERDDGEDEDEREQPCVPYAGAFEFGEATADGSSFGPARLV